MDTEGVFRDYFNAGTTLDENTFITDYWLDFVAVRDDGGEPRLRNRGVTQELCEKVQDFKHRIEVLLEDQRRIRIEFDQFIPKEHPTDRVYRSSHLNTAHPCAQDKVSNTRPNRSLADRFRGTFLYSTIQKLR